MNKMVEKIVLLEFTDEAEAFLKYCKDQSVSAKDFRIIALQPQVQVFLKRHDIPYENTLPYFTNQSHARALLQSEKWYQFLAKNINIEDGTEIKETYNDTFLFFMRFYMHHFLMYVEILSEIKNKYEIESIYACLFQNIIQKNDIPLIQDSERYVGVITKAFAKAHNINFKEIPVRLNVDKKKDKRMFNKIFSDIVSMLAIKMYWYFLGIFLNRRKVILLTSLGYNMGKITQGLKKKIPNVNFVVVSEAISCKQVAAMTIKCVSLLLKMSKNDDLPIILPIKPSHHSNLSAANNSQYLSRSIDGLLSKLKRDWHDEFSVEGVNFLDVMIERIAGDLKPYLIALYFKSLIMKRYFKKLNVKLVISPFARFTSFMIGELCRNHAIPALMIAHGPIVKPKNELEDIENRHLGKTLMLSGAYDCVAVQTPSEEEHYKYYKDLNGINEKQAIKTGPLVLAKVKFDRKKAIKKNLLGANIGDKKILLYPESARPRSAMRFHTFQSFDDFIASAADIINVVNEIGGVHLALRLHAGWGRDIDPAVLKSLLPKTDELTIISPDPSFSEVLTIADLLVNFSSTVIEDALQNHIPVLLYDRSGRYQHLEGQQLSCGKTPRLSALYYLNEPPYLKEGLEWILKNHLNTMVPKTLFDKYLFQEDYSNNLPEFVAGKVG